MTQTYLAAFGYLLGLSIFAYAFFSFLRRPIPEKAGPYQASWRPLETVAVTITIYLASSLMAAFLLYGFLGEMIENGSLKEDSTLLNFVYLLFFEAITISLVALFLKQRKFKLRSLGLRPPRLGDFGYAALGFLAYFAVLVVAEQFMPWVDFEQKQELGFSTTVAGPGLAVIFLSLVIIVPIVEELVMRGFLFAGLRTKLTLIPAALIASLLFGLAHLQPGSGKPLLWAAAVDTFILSLVLVALRVKTKSLIAPIMLHMIKNSIAFTFLFVLRI